MKILFVKETDDGRGGKWQPGMFGFFTNDYAIEKIRNGEAVEIPEKAGIKVINEILKSEILKLKEAKERKKKPNKD